jgi:hypothetical protein
MKLLRYIDYHWIGTDNKLDTSDKAKIEALIKQGREIDVTCLDKKETNDDKVSL